MNGLWVMPIMVTSLAMATSCIYCACPVSTRCSNFCKRWALSESSTASVKLASFVSFEPATCDGFELLAQRLEVAALFQLVVDTGVQELVGFAPLCPRIRLRCLRQNGFDSFVR